MKAKRGLCCRLMYRTKYRLDGHNRIVLFNSQPETTFQHGKKNSLCKQNLEDGTSPIYMPELHTNHFSHVVLLVYERHRIYQSKVDMTRLVHRPIPIVIGNQVLP